MLLLSILLHFLLKAKKKQKQGKMSAFFSAKEAATTKTEEANEPPAADAAEGAAALPGGRSGLKVLAVRYGIGSSKHDGEGRSITVEYDKARHIIYTPVHLLSCTRYLFSFHLNGRGFLPFFCDNGLDFRKRS